MNCLIAWNRFNIHGYKESRLRDFVLDCTSVSAVRAELYLRQSSSCWTVSPSVQFALDCISVSPALHLSLFHDDSFLLSLSLSPFVETDARSGYWLAWLISARS
jgi:hypothetical protein